MRRKVKKGYWEDPDAFSMQQRSSRANDGITYKSNVLIYRMMQTAQQALTKSTANQYWCIQTHTVLCDPTPILQYCITLYEKQDKTFVVCLFGGGSPAQATHEGCECAGRWAKVCAALIDCNPSQLSLTGCRERGRFENSRLRGGPLLEVGKCKREMLTRTFCRKNRKTIEKIGVNASHMHEERVRKGEMEFGR